MTAFPELNDRARHLLKTLITDYIQGGQPIGSTALARSSGLKLSAATIRNAMANLEEMGLICSPHTSAGRIPTSKGYRVFVDTLLTVQPLEEDLLQAISVSFNAAQPNRTTLTQSASALLSNVTGMAGIVTLQRMQDEQLCHIEFVRLSATQVLVILVMKNRQIQNRLLVVEKDYSTNELQHATNYLNELLEGKSLQDARSHLLKEMEKVQDNVAGYMQGCIELGKQAIFDVDREDDCVIAGKTNLVGYDDLADMDKLRELFTAFNDKREMLQLLDTTLNSEGVQIFIGRESGHDVFDDVSVVTSSYRSSGEMIGVLGIIGPKRMDYERVIPVVDITSRLLSASLKQEY